MALWPLLCLVMLAGAAEPEPDPPPPSSLAPFFERLRAGEAQTVVLYGTSLTRGGAWTKAIAEWFEARFPGQVTVVNSGGPGRTTRWGVDQLEPRVLAHRPDLVFIEFSYNDAHRKFEMTPEESIANLREIVTRVREARPGAAIVLMTMTAPWDATAENPPATSRPELVAFNDAWRAFAAGEHLPLIDHDAAWRRLQQADPDTYRAYLPDGSHPNAPGSLAITWAGVRAFLESAEPVQAHP